MRKGSRKKKGMEKEKAQRIHAKKRFKERLGILMTTAEINSIAETIRQQKAILFKRQSNRITLWDMNFNDRSIRVVYDSRTKNVVTVMLNGVQPQKEITHAEIPPATT